MAPLDDEDLGFPDADVTMGLSLMPGDDDVDVTPNREKHFNKRSGRFHDPVTGEFELGSPPPDLSPAADRYRAKNGQFKTRSTDLYDESDEVRLDSLDPVG